MRANDLDCGLLSDVFSFTVIHEFAAVQLGLELGTYTHLINAGHVNDANAQRVQRVLDEADTRPPVTFDFPSMPKDTTEQTVTLLLEHEQALRTNEARYSAAHIRGLDVDPYWQQVLLLFEVYRQLQHEKTGQVDRQIMTALQPGLRWLLAQRWPQCAAAAEDGGAR